MHTPFLTLAFPLVLRLFLICGLVWPSAVVWAESRPVTIWKGGDGWSVFLYRDDDQMFDRCSTVIEYRNGRILAFSVGRNMELIMRVAHATKGVGTMGQHLQNYVRIDDMEPRTAAAVVEQSASGVLSAVTNFHDDYRLFGNLRRGHVLALSGDLGDDTISLKGSARALRKMAECVPRPFSATPDYSVATASGAVITTKQPSRWGAEATSAKVQRLYDQLLGSKE